MLEGLWGTGVFSTNIYFLLDSRLTIIDTGYKGKISWICRKSTGWVIRLRCREYHIDASSHRPYRQPLQIKQLTGANIIAHAESLYIEEIAPLLPRPGKSNSSNI